MRDMHKERLTHLLATAIVELWKKETGSLSSVVIEGTICITSGTGKTTVLQVADRFSGSIPEAEDGGGGGRVGRHSYSSPESMMGRYNHTLSGSGNEGGGVMRSFSMPHCYNDSAPRVDCQNQAAMAAFLDNLSPASLISPGTDYSRSSRESRSPNTTATNTSLQTNREQGMDVSSGSIKDENISESGSDNSVPEDNNNNSHKMVPSKSSNTEANGDVPPTGTVCPGTGYYTCATTEMNNNTIDPKYAHKIRSPSSSHSSPERNKRRHSRERSLDRESAGSERKRSSLESPQEMLRDGSKDVDINQEVHNQQDAVDLTRKGVDDLALSPPQSYTAQVRDVIRNKLLMGKSGTTGDASSMNETRIDLHEESSPNHHPLSKSPVSNQHGENTPKVLETLGLHRSEMEQNANGQYQQNHVFHNNERNSYTASEKGHAYERERRDSFREGDHSRERDHSREQDGPRERGDGFSFSHSPRGHFNRADGNSPIPASPDELRVTVNHHATPRTSNANHPLLASPISPIISSSGDMISAHSPLPSPSSSISSSPAPNSNGPLHSILRHRPFPPLPLMHRTSLVHSGPRSAPPLFTHPGFSPLQNPHLSMQQQHHPTQMSPRDASPSPTDLSLDSSGDSEKELGPNGEQRIYRCEFCTKTFLFKSKYHEHLPVHTNARPFQCHLCSRTYKYKYDLRVHLRTHMGIPTKSTVCPFCNTKFDTNKRLRVHIKDAHKDKQKLTEEDGPPERLTPKIESASPIFPKVESASPI